MGVKIHVLPESLLDSDGKYDYETVNETWIAALCKFVTDFEAANGGGGSTKNWDGNVPQNM